MRPFVALLSAALVTLGLALEHHYENRTSLSANTTASSVTFAYHHNGNSNGEGASATGRHEVRPTGHGALPSGTGYGTASSHLTASPPSSTPNVTMSSHLRTHPSEDKNTSYTSPTANHSETHTATAQSQRTPQATLYPAVHRGINRTNADILKPARAGNGVPLHYIQESLQNRSAPLTVAVATPQFKADSVVLEDSAFIQEVEFTSPPDELHITFNNKDAFQRSQLDWSADEGLILITHTAGCRGVEAGERCFFLADRLRWDPEHMQVHATGAVSTLEDVIDQMDLEWGVMEPKKSDSQRSANTECAGPMDEEISLPTECPGPNFDANLDDALGYEARPFGFEWEANASDADEEGPDRDIHSSQTRSNGFRRAFESVGIMVEDIADFVDDGFDKLREADWWGTQNFTARRDGLLIPPRPADCLNGTNELCKPKDKSMVIVPSPWGKGDAILMKSFGFGTTAPIIPNSPQNQAMAQLNLWCVDCGLSGSVAILGKITIMPGKGITEGFVQVDADIKAALKLGIEGKMEHFFSSPRKTLFEAGLPGFTIPAVATVGPILNIAVDFRINTAIKGKVLAGGEYYISKAMYRFDFKNEQMVSQGWEPSFRPVLEADVEGRLAAELGLPISVSLGLRFLGGECRWCKWDISVETRPAIEAVAGQVGTGTMVNSTAGVQHEFNSTDVVRKVVTKNDCKGISSHLQWKNVVMAVAFVAGQRFQQILMDTGSRLIAEKCHTFPNFTRRSVTLGDERKLNTKLVELTDAVVPTSDYLNYNYALEPQDLNSGTGYNRLGGLEEPWRLYGCDDDNLYIRDIDSEGVSGCNDIWAYHDAVVGANGVGRHMHYYENTMSTLGVSRLRLSETSLVPKSSTYVTLAASDPRGPAVSSVYLAVDENSKILYPAVCRYADARRPSRVFLVANPETGLSALESPELEHSVTGGKVAECAFLPLFRG